MPRCHAGAAPRLPAAAPPPRPRPGARGLRRRLSRPLLRGAALRRGAGGARMRAQLRGARAGGRRRGGRAQEGVNACAAAEQADLLWPALPQATRWRCMSMQSTQRNPQSLQKMWSVSRACGRLKHHGL